MVGKEGHPKILEMQGKVVSMEGSQTKHLDIHERGVGKVSGHVCVLHPQSLERANIVHITKRCCMKGVKRRTKYGLGFTHGSGPIKRARKKCRGKRGGRTMGGRRHYFLCSMVIHPC